MCPWRPSRACTPTSSTKAHPNTIKVTPHKLINSLQFVNVQQLDIIVGQRIPGNTLANLSNANREIGYCSSAVSTAVETSPIRDYLSAPFFAFAQSLLRIIVTLFYWMKSFALSWSIWYFIFLGQEVSKVGNAHGYSERIIGIIYGWIYTYVIAFSYASLEPSRRL